MSVITRKALAVLSSAVLLVASASSHAQELQFNMTRGVTEVANDIYDLHMIVVWLCVIVGIGVYGMMIYSIINHRKSKHPQPATFHENTTVEVVWTVIPFLILVALAVPATKTLMEIENIGEADITIQATGYQWKWKYDYLDEGISYFSALDAKSNEIRQTGSGMDPNTHEHYLLDVDNPVVLPVNKRIRILTTANDVIHAWWVPDLAVKRDAIPGYINESWTQIKEPGTYRGQCAELCGKDHGFMPIVVKAVPEEEYKQWVAAKQAEKASAEAAAGKTYGMDELMAHGEKVYNTACASCHMPTGDGIPNVFPALKGSKIAAGPVADHLNIVVHGSKKNPAMAAYGPQMNDLDLAAVITYERNAWGNNTGDVVQPADVKAAR
jgi:cytochrome c oxidase subunit 2